ncbi:hypothetical protein M569_11137, partial [Genlisea aurea]
DGNNFVAWSKAVRIAIGGRDCLGHLDGTAAPPPQGPKPAATADAELKAWDALSRRHHDWQRTDFQVMTMILNSMEKDLAEAFVFANTAKELWEEIDRRFGASVEPQIFHLRSELQTLVQGEDTVVAYYTKLKHIWNQLDSLRPLP